MFKETDELLDVIAKKYGFDVAKEAILLSDEEGKEFNSTYPVKVIDNRWKKSAFIISAIFFVIGFVVVNVVGFGKGAPFIIITSISFSIGMVLPTIYRYNPIRNNMLDQKVHDKVVSRLNELDEQELAEVEANKAYAAATKQKNMESVNQIFQDIISISRTISSSKDKTIALSALQDDLTKLSGNPSYIEVIENSEELVEDLKEIKEMVSSMEHPDKFILRRIDKILGHKSS